MVREGAERLSFVHLRSDHDTFYLMICDFRELPLDYGSDRRTMLVDGLSACRFSLTHDFPGRRMTVRRTDGAELAGFVPLLRSSALTVLTSMRSSLPNHCLQPLPKRRYG